MPRLFELTPDNNPNTANRISFGRAGFAALNMTLANFLTWLNSNLSFPSYSTTQLILNINDWDMDATLSINVAHGLADYKKIRSAKVMIYSDDDAILYPGAHPLDGPLSAANTAQQGGIEVIDNTNVTLNRLTGGRFDSTDYNATSFNRGYIVIEYIP